jgi:phage-Barnase-EndoU-ColicinE5/D-RelE like nuclease2
MSKRKIVAVITDILGDRVVVCEKELQHSIDEHFEILPTDILLELLERVLKDPTVIFEETRNHCYHLFYRLDNGRHIVAVIKKSKSGVFFSTIYPTGKKIRNKHKNLKKVSV